MNFAVQGLAFLFPFGVGRLVGLCMVFSGS